MKNITTGDILMDLIMVLAVAMLVPELTNWRHRWVARLVLAGCVVMLWATK